MNCKIRIDKKIQEKLNNDMEYFDINYKYKKGSELSKLKKSSNPTTPNKLYNNILKYYKKEYDEIDKIPPIENKEKQKETIDVCVSIDFYNIYYEKNYEIIDKFISSFHMYSNEPRYKREKIVFNSTYQKLKKAISENKKVNINYGVDIYENISILPRFFKKNNEENGYYLVAYSMAEKRLRTFKLCRIKYISAINIEKSILKEVENEISEMERKIKENFDPFLNITEKMIVKFTKKGLDMYNDKMINRPRETEASKRFCIKEYYNPNNIEFENVKYVNNDTNIIIMDITNKEIFLEETMASKEMLIKEFYVIPFAATIYFSSFFENAVIMDEKYMKNFIKKLKKSISKNEIGQK